MNTAQQLPLALGYRPALNRDDFLVAPCNTEAVAWLDRWPDWPGVGLAVYGPAGSGKTHLAQVWCGASGATMVEARALSGADLSTLSSAPVVVENLDEDYDEEALLHLYNMLANGGRHLLVTGKTAPARLAIALPDLKSRLSTLSAVAIRAPDDALLAAVMVKQFADRQLQVSEDVVAFLMPRIERSFAAVGSLVAALDGLALAQHRKITVPLARQVLDQIGNE
jgi:DnaA regulatory inactivator Hda